MNGAYSIKYLLPIINFLHLPPTCPSTALAPLFPPPPIKSLAPILISRDSFLFFRCRFCPPYPFSFAPIRYLGLSPPRRPIHFFLLPSPTFNDLLHQPTTPAPQSNDLRPFSNSSHPILITTRP